MKSKDFSQHFDALDPSVLSCVTLWGPDPQVRNQKPVTLSPDSGWRVAYRGGLVMCP